MESYSNSFLIRVFFFPFKFKINKKIFDKKQEKKKWDLAARKGNSIKKKLKTFNQESGPIYHQKKKNMWSYFIGNVLIGVKMNSFMKLYFSFVST